MARFSPVGLALQHALNKARLAVNQCMLLRTVIVVNIGYGSLNNVNVGEVCSVLYIRVRNNVKVVYILYISLLGVNDLVTSIDKAMLRRFDHLERIEYNDTNLLS